MFEAMWQRLTLAQRGVLRAAVLVVAVLAAAVALAPAQASQGLFFVNLAMLTAFAGWGAVAPRLFRALGCELVELFCVRRLGALLRDDYEPAEDPAPGDDPALRAAAEKSLKGILEFCTEELVSIDFKGNAASSIVDAPSTMVIGGNMVKVLSWYDNEWGYSMRVVDLLGALLILVFGFLFVTVSSRLASSTSNCSST